MFLQEVLGEENADQVAINFFGDGTCNVGEPSLSKAASTAVRVSTSTWTSSRHVWLSFCVSTPVCKVGG